MTAMVFKYGLAQPLDWGADCDAQLMRANQLWNKLVEVEHGYIEEIRAALHEDATVAGIAADIDELNTRISGLKTQRAQARQQARKGVHTPKTDEAIKDLVQELRRLYTAYKAAKRISAADNQARFKQIVAARFETVKKVRQEAAANGLWWGNYNAVLDSFETAAVRARKTGAELHFRRYDGQGRLTNQIQGGLTVADLFAGKHSQVQMVVANPQANERLRYHLVVTAFAEQRVKRMVRFPIIFHRPLPEHASIRSVAVHHRKEFDLDKWYVTFNITVADEAPQPTGALAVINFGWRKVDDSVRVATVLRNGAIDHVLVPPRLLAGQEAGERNRSRMDGAINDMGAWLTRLDVQRANPATQDVVAKLRAFKRLRGNHFEWLRKTWEMDSPGWNKEMLTELQEFGRKWRRFSRDDAAGRQWVKDARQHHYRLEIRRIIGDASVVLMNEHDMSDTARRESDLPLPARRLRVLTAPSLLRNALVEYAQRAGIRIVIDTQPHHACACHEQPFVEPDRSKLMWTCPVTHLGLDQDEDHCRGMLRRFRMEELTVAQGEKTAATYRPNRKRRPVEASATA